MHCGHSYFYTPFALTGHDSVTRRLPLHSLTFKVVAKREQSRWQVHALTVDRICICTTLDSWEFWRIGCGFAFVCSQCNMMIGACGHLFVCSRPFAQFDVNLPSEECGQTNWRSQCVWQRQWPSQWHSQWQSQWQACRQLLKAVQSATALCPLHQRQPLSRLMARQVRDCYSSGSCKLLKGCVQGLRGSLMFSWVCPYAELVRVQHAMEI